jgi:hypothetical protein
VTTPRIVALVVAVGLGVVVTRVVWDGRQALAAGDAAMAAGDARGALEGWRRAARWYAPGAPHVADAYARMEALARAAEEHGDDGLALAAWRGVRSSSLSTRSFYTPFASVLAVANERIAALTARKEVELDPSRQEAEQRELHLSLLTTGGDPSIPWTIVALAGFAAWVGGGFWFARRAVTEDDRLERRTAIRAAALTAVGLVVWMVGLYQA